LSTLSHARLWAAATVVSASNTSSRGGVDLQTLVITAVASACAAYVTSEVWAPGTLASAAITPVIVALVKEALAKPADVVTRAVPVRGVVRSASRFDEPYDPIQPFTPEDERVAQHGEILGSSRALPRHAWRVAVVTGLLGFLVAAVIITVPEFVAGKAAAGGEGQTTFFGGGKQKSPEPSTTTTTTAPAETESAPVEPTVTVPPVETTTVPPAEPATVPPVERDPQPQPQPQPESTPEPLPEEEPVP
jgi:hypothetical protein